MDDTTTIFRYAVLGRHEDDHDILKHRLHLVPPSDFEMRHLDAECPDAAPHRIVRVKIGVAPYVDDRWQELTHFDHDMWAGEGRKMVPNLSSNDMKDYADLLRRTIDKAVELGIVTKVGAS